ncbi:Predicted dithiol-disulfide isomerase, DsbA family [Siphonobacter aquaeclarae]|uniref:Predicted dithiol-disulfide isomerase, DsbA family n=2 Tax=Siphonobacter aquaeclarae TaxID=563176 RepID=A0A1G9HE48_9BACT|nr:Predicted dithiol-disulfide isomerase, DsbA family [Siphonobacter aquaeclarae]
MMNKPSTNPLLCDIESGMCEMPEPIVETTKNVVSAEKKPLKVIYYTDPICSSCWGIEPQLRKLKLEYGHALDIEYRMGGLLPDWSYNSGGISKPSDVAHHWDEVSAYYDMPIDGDVWLEDPLDSSYPPSIAFKAAQLQGAKKAIAFLRKIREMVFLQKKNITRPEYLRAAAEAAELDVDRFEQDFPGRARELFQEDLALARQLGVRGFPTMFFVDENGQMEKVYGTKPYAVYEQALLGQAPAVRKAPYATNWESLFAVYPTLTSREFAELAETARKDADPFLQQLADAGALEKEGSKNGVLWKRK